MKKLHAFFIVPALIAGAATLRAQETTYAVDPVHSVVLAEVMHFSASHVWVRFDGPNGTVTINDADPSKNSFSFEAKAESLNSAVEKRDQDLKGPDLLNVKEFPTITFKSTGMKKTGDKTYEASGNLTLHGVTKPVTARVTYVGTGKGMKGETRSGADATFNIKRSDFGIGPNFPPAVISDEVNLQVSVEAIKK